MLTLTLTRNIDGSLTISTIYDNYHVHRTYFYYTKMEAIKLFKIYLNSL